MPKIPDEAADVYRLKPAFKKYLKARGPGAAPRGGCKACGGTGINSKGGPCEPCTARRDAARFAGAGAGEETREAE